MSATRASARPTRIRHCSMTRWWKRERNAIPSSLPTAAPVLDRRRRARGGGGPGRRGRKRIFSRDSAQIQANQAGDAPPSGGVPCHEVPHCGMMLVAARCRAVQPLGDRVEQRNDPPGCAEAAALSHTGRVTVWWEPDTGDLCLRRLVCAVTGLPMLRCCPEGVP